MKLYYAPGACSLSPHIVLRELGFDFELERVDLAEKKTASGSDYYTINPKGYVPALRLDDGQILTEGPVITQYLADRMPEKRLAPPLGSMERYRLMELLNFITTELHKSYGPLFNPRTPPEWKTIVRDLIGKRVAHVASLLNGKSYLMGDDFTVADAYLFTVLNWSGRAEVDLSHWPSIHAYQTRVASRPAVQAAMKAEGLLK